MQHCADLSIRQWFAVVLLFAFFGTNYAVETHVHQTEFAGRGSVSIAKIAPGKGRTGPVDNGEDEKRCPLCQAFLLNGSFVAPVAPLFVLPVLAGMSEPIQFMKHAIVMWSHSWQGRGPPTVA